MICLPAFAKSFSVIGLRIGNHLFFKHSQKLLLQTLMTRWIFGGSFGFWTESMDIQEYNLFRLIKKFFDIPNVWIEEIDYKIYKRQITFLAVSFCCVLYSMSMTYSRTICNFWKFLGPWTMLASWSSYKWTRISKNRIPITSWFQMVSSWLIEYRFAMLWAKYPLNCLIAPESWEPGIITWWSKCLNDLGDHVKYIL